VTEHLTRMVVDRHGADLAAAAEHSRLARAARAARAARPQRHPVRASAARLLVAMAARLDARPATPRPLRHTG
jgi:hypothetical protein